MQITIISPIVRKHFKKRLFYRNLSFSERYRFLKIDSKIDLFNRLIDQIESIISESILFFEDRPSLSIIP